MSASPHRTHWWRVGKRTPRKRYPLRWRPGSTPPLVAWAEFRDWGLASIRRQTDGRLEASVVDKTRQQPTVVVSDIKTCDEAKTRASEAAQRMATDRERRKPHDSLT